MANLKVMDQNGKDSGEVTLNDKVFGIEPNESVVFEAIIRQRAGKRQGTSKVKNRSAVRGGGKKLGDKRVLVVLVKALSELHNGVVVVQYLAQLLVHMHTQCQESNVVWLLSQFFPKS